MRMICKNPYMSAGRAFGCGQCMPCRLNKRRVWAHRICLEAAQYEDNAFVTLTYSDDCLPEGATLVPEHAQKFLKRLRKKIEPEKIRFFLVGEYGDATFRPHYHIALFNFPSCEFGMSRYSRTRVRCCTRCDLVADTWGKGNVLLGSLGRESAAYISGYVTKKMTGAGDERLRGRYPEFARMSLRPGIGGDAMWEVADVLMAHRLEEKIEDAPSTLRHGSAERPLGRYLQGRLREQIGRIKSAPQSVMDKIDAEMLPLRQAAKNSEDNPSLKSRVVENNLGKIQRVEAKARIFKSSKTL